MLGVEQGGVAETMQFVLSCYPAHIQQELVNVSSKEVILCYDWCLFVTERVRYWW